jgi:hypothetical protein
MTMDGRIEADLKALAERTRHGLATLEQTACALEETARRKSGGFFMRRPVVVTICALAVVATLLVVPIPYSRTVGYDLIAQRPDGKVVTVHLPRGSAAQAKRGAEGMRERGMQVTIAPRAERVWGTVYAMAKDKLMRIDVDMDGKTDAEVESEIAAQLQAAGWTPSVVRVERNDQGATVRVGADDGLGRHIEVVHKLGDGHVEIRAGDLDDAREPGMTDEELRDKLLAQLRARGVDADVIVRGDQIEIRAKRIDSQP